MSNRGSFLFSFFFLFSFCFFFSFCSVVFFGRRRRAAGSRRERGAAIESRASGHSVVRYGTLALESHSAGRLIGRVGRYDNKAVVGRAKRDDG